MASPTCPSQLIVTPDITCVSGRPNKAKMQAVSVVVGQQATIYWVMKDPKGVPVDLTACFGLVNPASVVLMIREAIMLNPGDGTTIIGSLVNTGSDGLVQATLTADVVSFPGISRCEFGIVDSNGNLIFSNEFYLIVNRGQFAPAGASVQPLGPPTLPEIRLHLRDSDPVDNLWLAVQEFDMAEIAACIERPIHYFNEAPPPIAQRYNTANFPARYYYLEAIVGCLYSMASLHYARTHLPYQQAGGLTVDDKNKMEQYAAIAKERWEGWKDWVRHKKIQLNAAAAFQTLSSPYLASIWQTDTTLIR